MIRLAVTCINGNAAKGLCQWLNDNDSPDASRHGAVVTVPTQDTEYVSRILSRAFTMGWITNSQLAYAFTGFQNALSDREK